MVEVAHHARIREACSCRSAECSIPEEVAADKTLALFIRATARDLVDVAALSQRYILEQLCELAAEKDPGFDRGRCVGRDRSSLRQSFAELGLEPKAVAAPRAGAARCRAQLLGAAGMYTPDAVQSFRARRCRGRKRPALPALRNRLNVIGHHRSTRGETANQRPLSVWQSSILPAGR